MDHIMSTKLRWFSAVILVIMDLVLLLLNAFLMVPGVGELKDHTAKSSPVENYQHLQMEIKLELKLPMAPQPSSLVTPDSCLWALL